MQSTNGMAFTRGPSPRNRLAMSLVKVPSITITTTYGRQLHTPAEAARETRLTTRAKALWLAVSYAVSIDATVAQDQFASRPIGWVGGSGLRAWVRPRA